MAAGRRRGAAGSAAARDRELQPGGGAAPGRGHPPRPACPAVRLPAPLLCLRQRRPTPAAMAGDRRRGAGCPRPLQRVWDRVPVPARPVRAVDGGARGQPAGGAPTCAGCSCSGSGSAAMSPAPARPYTASCCRPWRRRSSAGRCRRCMCRRRSHGKRPRPPSTACCTPPALPRQRRKRACDGAWPGSG